MMNMSDILRAEAVRSVASASSKKQLLQSISDHAEAVYGVDSREVLEALQMRESLGTTGVGKGVAIPHARFKGVDGIVGLFTRLEKPVNFDSLDKQPVDLVFTLLAPIADNPDHLKALALVSRTLRQKEICEKLRFNSDPQTLFSILTEYTATKAA